jgi:hypothetical protein
MADSTFYLRNISRLSLTIIECTHSVAVAIPCFLTEVFIQPTCARFSRPWSQHSLRRCPNDLRISTVKVTLIYARHPLGKIFVLFIALPGDRGKVPFPPWMHSTFIISLNCSTALDPTRVVFHWGSTFNVQPPPQRSVSVQSTASTERPKILGRILGRSLTDSIPTLAS